MSKPRSERSTEKKKRKREPVKKAKDDDDDDEFEIEGEEEEEDDDIEKVEPKKKKRVKKWMPQMDYVQISQRRRRATVRATASTLPKVGTRVDIREYYPDDGEQLPGKKGINLSIEEWEALKKKIPEIDAMIAKEMKREEEYEKYRMSIID